MSAYGLNSVVEVLDRYLSTTKMMFFLAILVNQSPDANQVKRTMAKFGLVDSPTLDCFRADERDLMMDTK